MQAPAQQELTHKLSWSSNYRSSRCSSQIFWTNDTDYSWNHPADIIGMDSWYHRAGDTGPSRPAVTVAVTMVPHLHWFKQRGWRLLPYVLDELLAHGRWTGPATPEVQWRSAITFTIITYYYKIIITYYYIILHHCYNIITSL